jgi:uncharacterized protein (DUF433 family)
MSYLTYNFWRIPEYFDWHFFLIFCFFIVFFSEIWYFIPGMTPLSKRKVLMSSVSALQEAEKLLFTMTRAEKAQLLQWVARDLGDAFPGIESNPGICGGEPCIVRTRIPVWILVQAKRLGKSEADLLQAYPTLRAEDLANAWAYTRSHEKEINRQIRENEDA